MEDHPLDAFLAQRVDDIRELVEFDLGPCVTGDIPPALRFHFKGLDAVLIPNAATDDNGADSISVEITLWDDGSAVAEPSTFVVARQPIKEN